MFKPIRILATIYTLWWLSLYFLFKGGRRQRVIQRNEIYRDEVYQAMLDRDETWMQIGDGRADIVNNCSLMDC
jgi:hypothetical protein